MESPAREAYRKRCKHYGKASGLCCEQSHYYCKGEATIAVDILCTSDCNCARMKRYDKMNKHK